jgi:hypothetical protein
LVGAGWKIKGLANLMHAILPLHTIDALLRAHFSNL